ncbi:hypothetical protein HOLleu_19089 [Holothuria leucospilota]|uniref:Uncharacterized protein n=1 Tax=Holothuria leucospilota TaxID=206669 RepID=A0A9Q1C556_HOLLE|nr:hypothetical protein HOLleu_19089 [Holothuria leucospilota]
MLKYPYRKLAATRGILRGIAFVPIIEGLRQRTESPISLPHAVVTIIHAVQEIMKPDKTPRKRKKENS